MGACGHSDFVRIQLICVKAEMAACFLCCVAGLGVCDTLCCTLICWQSCAGWSLVPGGDLLLEVVFAMCSCVECSDTKPWLS